MSPVTLRRLAIEAAARGEWIKAAALKDMADSRELAQRHGRDPYNAKPAPLADRWAPAFPGHATPAQHETAASMLAARDPLTLEY